MTVASQTLPAVDLSWDTRSMMWKDHENTFHTHVCNVQCLSSMPDLPSQEIMLDRLYLPMEWLLARHVSLPLKQVSMVDAEMLFQELADSGDLDAADWWLTWRLYSCEEGVAGMVFGLPKSLRTSIQDSDKWSKVKEVLVDGYERLQAYVQEGQACLVLDQDADGIFFGVYDGQAWRGMRRLNGDVDEELWLQLWHSCIAMGFDTDSDIVCGRIDSALQLKLEAEHMTWQGSLLETLSSRHEANLSLYSSDEKCSLNIRHGRWSAGQNWGGLRVWKRSAVLCMLIGLAWMIGAVSDLNRVGSQIEAYEQRIETAFHQGLPNEPVMLDALAQLRQAAGGSATSRDVVFLSSLQVVSEVYQSTPWQLKILELRDGEMHMIGEVKDIESLNHIQLSLKQGLKKDVSIADANISGKEISFRMHW